MVSQKIIPFLLHLFMLKHPTFPSKKVKLKQHFKQKSFSRKMVILTIADCKDSFDKKSLQVQ